MKFILSILFVLISLSCNISQKLNDVKIKKIKSKFIETENFGIRKNPITNREYLIFLCWYIENYGESYPEKVINILPLESINENDFCSGGFTELLTNSHSILRNYILNIKYLDYPVLGLTNAQVSEMARWLSDRYNENILIQLGYLRFRASHKDEDCFVTEAYLLNQYQGDMRNGKTMHWNDKKFLPTFRLPYEEEVRQLKYNLKDERLIKEYDFNSKDFLWLWGKYYLKIDKSANKISLNLFPSINFSCVDTFKLELSHYYEAMLTDKTDEFRNAMYLDEAKFHKKNEFGKMRFYIIGENNLDRPIIASEIYFEYSDNPGVNRIFRIAYNRKIEFKYWP